MNLAGVLSAAPFNGRAAFSFNEFFSALPSAFTVLSTDSDYLFFGSAFSVGSKNFPIVLSDGADAKSVIRATRGESGFVVAVGNGKFISYCRAAAKINGFSLAAVFTDLSFSYAFTPIAEYLLGGGLVKLDCDLPEKVLIDVKKLSTLKKGALADGFSFAASFLCLIPLRSESFKNSVLAAVNTLLSIKNDSFASIVKANLFAALASCDGGFYSDAYFIGRILSLLSGNGEEECCFFACEYVLRLYCLLKTVDFSSVLSLPDYLTPIDSLAELTGGKSEKILSSFCPLSDSEVLSAIAEFKQKIADNEVIDGLFDKLNALKHAYSLVYNGRKNRSRVKREDFVKSVRLAGVYSSEALKILLSGGYDFLLNVE